MTDVGQKKFSSFFQVFFSHRSQRFVNQSAKIAFEGLFFKLFNALAKRKTLKKAILSAYLSAFYRGVRGIRTPEPLLTTTRFPEGADRGATYRYISS